MMHSAYLRSIERHKTRHGGALLSQSIDLGNCNRSFTPLRSVQDDSRAVQDDRWAVQDDRWAVQDDRWAVQDDNWTSCRMR